MPMTIEQIVEETKQWSPDQVDKLFDQLLANHYGKRGVGGHAGSAIAETLKNIIGSANGPGDLSTNKAHFNDYGRPRAR